MDLVIGFSILISPVLLALMLHIFRDVRGKARNSRDECYSCGKSYKTSETRYVVHSNSNMYGYCKSCGDRHKLWEAIALATMLLCGAGTLAILSLSTFDTNPQKSLILAGIALAIVILIALAAIRYASLNKSTKRKID